jgi:hypothetical protein
MPIYTRASIAIFQLSLSRPTTCTAQKNKGRRYLLVNNLCQTAKINFIINQAMLQINGRSVFLAPSELSQLSKCFTARCLYITAGHRSVSVPDPFLKALTPLMPPLGLKSNNG